MSMFRKVCTVAAAGAISVATLAVGAPASARPAGSPETFTLLTSGPMHVTTTSGKHLLLSIQANRFASNSGGSNAHRPSTLNVTLVGNGGHERHQWSFHLAANSFTDAAGGDGSLKTGAQIAPYGRLKLTISPLSNATTHVCDNANRQIIHRVALKGTLSFRSHSGGPNSWGTVAHRSVGFTHGRLSAGHGPDVEEGCAHIPCQAGILWTAHHGNLDLNGFDVAAKGKTAQGHLEGDRLTNITTPAHAFRLDIVVVKTPTPTLVKSGGVETLHATTSGGIASGSATLTSTGHGPYNQSCATGQTSGTMWNAHYKADAAPLTLHEQIFGPITIATDKAADFIKVHIT